MSPWWLRFTPHPDSDPALDFHHRPWTLTEATLGVDTGAEPGFTVCVIGPARPAP